MRGRGGRLRTGLVVLFAVVAGACSSGDTATSTSTSGSGGDGGTVTEQPAGTVTVVTYNVLHGLPLGNCPEETDGCQGAARLSATWDLLEEAGCPDVVGLQEIGPQQQELLPSTLPEICDGDYQVVSDDPGLPVEQVIISTLPSIDAASEPISGISRSIQWVRLDSPIGPVDVYTTHYVASVDDLPCDEELCGELCEPGVDAGVCNPVETLDVVDRTADPATLTILTGDLNATYDEPRIQTLVDGGFEDVWILAGNEDCDPDDASNCTSGQHGDGPYDGLDVAASTRSERIDFVLVRAPDDCAVAVDGVDLFAGEPLDPPVEGVFWPSDHIGVVTGIACG